MLRLILASQSAYRLELLRDAGYDVVAIPSNIDEPDPATFASIEAGLSHIAELKARAVWKLGNEGLIFAADTVGYVDGKVFGKPVDREDARRMLAAISGTRHDVLTGWCLFHTPDERMLSGVERTRITMRPWTAAELEGYLDSREWEEKCGAYGLLPAGDPFVTHIEGSATNVIGVPIERLQQVLPDFVRPA